MGAVLAANALTDRRGGVHDLCRASAKKCRASAVVVHGAVERPARAFTLLRSSCVCHRSPLPARLVAERQQKIVKKSRFNRQIGVRTFRSPTHKSEADRQPPQHSKISRSRNKKISAKKHFGKVYADRSCIKVETP